MIELRNKLRNYDEYFYLVFIFLMSCCAGLGFSSSEVRYMVLFLIASIFLLMKIIVTDYSRKEFIWMLFLSIVVALVFLINRQKTLIITLMAIFGSKNVNLLKIFKVMFYPRLLCTITVLCFVFLGIIPNISRELPKASEFVTIFSYGYGHPNTFYINLFILTLLMIMIYKEKLKWYLYIIFTVVLFFSYTLVRSRTGWYLYLLFCALLLLYYLLKKTRLKKYFLNLLVCIPVGISFFSYFVCFLYKSKNLFAIWLDKIVTGRIDLMSKAFSSIPYSLFGNKNTFLLDNAYINLLLNYGIICLLLYVCFFTLTMVKLRKINCDYELIVMGITAIFAFMEVSPLHVFWSPCLLYMSLLLFGSKKEAES